MSSECVTSHAKSKIYILRNLLPCPFTPEVPTFLNTHVSIHRVPCMSERVLLDMLYLAWPVLDEQIHIPHLSLADENGCTFTFCPCLGSSVGTSGLDVLLCLGRLAVSPTMVPPTLVLVCSGRGICPSLYLFFF